MKSCMILFLALLMAVSTFAQGGGRRHREGDGRHHSWRGGSASRHHYIHRTHHHHHRYGGYRHAGYRSGWRHYGYYPRASYIYLDRDLYGYGYGYSGYGYGGLGYGRSGYGSSGLWWGALAGAVIGHNSGDLRNNPWRGAALGATAGYVLGSIADHRVERREAAADTQLAENPNRTHQPTSVTPAAPAAAPVVTPSRSQPSSSMSAANSLFGR